ncbi:phage major capsid protein [Streptomyces sp. NPDC052535]|uniref:phage major capsid protein n=1 Tax=Streptomyces sp. NPDC052535 TaxID=3155531 RepID=UPI00341DD332
MPDNLSPAERLRSRIADLEASFDDLRKRRRQIIDHVEARGDIQLTGEESAEHTELTAQIKGVQQDLDRARDRLTDFAPTRGYTTPGADAVRRAQLSVREGRTYERGNGASYFQDLVRTTMNMDGDGQARERLQRHAHDVAEAVERRDLDRTDGSGGHFVPPLWAMNQFIELARAGRAYANLCERLPLPAGTDSINIPKVSSGTSTSIQTADNSAVSETDMDDTSVAAPVRTIAGQQDVAIQLLDQSPVSFDQVIFRDLVADYATKVDLQVIAGSGSSGQVTGIRSTSGIETIALATGTVAAVYAKIADAVQRVHTGRFMPPTVIVMHPRRWAWFLAALDANDRPLVVPNAGNPQNAIATLGVVGAEQVVGQMHGLPVVTDPNMPTTLGTSTNEDVIHIVRASDLLLYESGIRSRVLPDVGSGTLTARLQVYGYLAFTAGRYPQSVVEIGGAGLAAPTFTGA